MDFAELVETLWMGRWTIVIATVGLMVLAIAYSLVAKPIYRAEVVLSPVSEDSMRSSLGALSGLASFAGIDLPTGDKSVEAVAILKSRGFAREFIESHDLMDAMLAERARSWFGRSAGEPDIRVAVETFDRGVRRVSEDRKTGLVTLSIRWKDGVEAANWANALVGLLNARMRSRALDETARNITYLRKEISTTQVISLEQAIGRLLEAEMQKYLLASGNDEFAFKVIDAAVAPRRPFWPRPVLLAGLAMLIGAICSGAYVLLRGKR
jgi:uncharacterized protein involved in exopolysaccharide biosynthesis